jgi:xanthine dehydrogenase accessory factor
MGNRDEEGLLAVIGARPRYLGLVASKKKSEALFAYVRETGSTDDDLAVITCPAGIEIGSKTLPEIALSVAAEIIRVRRTNAEAPAPAVKSMAPTTATDPICGMTVDIESARYSSVAGDQTIYFCCLRCKETFDRPPVSQITRS